MAVHQSPLLHPSARPGLLVGEQDWLIISLHLFLVLVEHCLGKLTRRFVHSCKPMEDPTPWRPWDSIGSSGFRCLFASLCWHFHSWSRNLMFLSGRNLPICLCPLLICTNPCVDWNSHKPLHSPMITPKFSWNSYGFQTLSKRFLAAERSFFLPLWLGNDCLLNVERPLI